MSSSANANKTSTAAAATATTTPNPVVSPSNLVANKPVEIPTWFRFVSSGLSGMMATSVVQPIDLLKTRMQLAGEGGTAPRYKNSFDALTSVWKTEGTARMYTGLTAALFRQATYTTTRLGLYMTLFEMLTTEDRPPSFPLKLGIACLSGAAGAIVGTPAEVALIRMTADGRRKPEERRNYRNVFNALARITREEGLVSLWKGCGPTVGRAVILNAAQLSVYSQAKEMLVNNIGYFNNLGDKDIRTHFVASLFSALICTIVSLPVDTVKTRIQNADAGQYRGALDVMSRTVKAEGPLALWKGFNFYFLRIGPHTILTFVIAEAFLNMYRRAATTDGVKAQ